jgi:ppGpp synthetase/RelA/SpoT-type nucleotidyltranferase
VPQKRLPKRKTPAEPSATPVGAGELDQDAFLAKYRISKDTFASIGIDWSDLRKIYHHHQARTPSLLPTAQHIAERLRSVKEVHSLKIRIKDPEHLLEKIVRKAIERPKVKISPDNYTTRITDLIGIRVLHLFKEDWLPIHEFITGEWESDERPTANVRRGDPDDLISAFKAHGCKIKEHRLGYRSIHYLVKSQPTRETHVAEVQVRTLFEEGWSEIDHLIRYPYDTHNPSFSRMLAILNRVAGGADEIGSYIRASHHDEMSRADLQSKRAAAFQEVLAKVDTLSGVGSNTRQSMKMMVAGLEGFTTGGCDANPFFSAVDNVSRWQAHVNRRTASWLALEHRANRGLTTTVVMGEQYGTQRSARSISEGEHLIIADAENSGLDAYDLNGKRVGRLQNHAPIEYEEFVHAMKLCYGSTPWRVHVVKVLPSETRSGIRYSWLAIAFDTKPIGDTSSRPSPKSERKPAQIRPEHRRKKGRSS